MTSPRTYRRRQFLGLAATASTVGAVAGVGAWAVRGRPTETQAEPRAAAVELRLEGQPPVVLGPGDLLTGSDLDSRKVARVVRRSLPPRRQVTDGRATLTLSVDRAAAVGAVLQAAREGGVVNVELTPMASTRPAPAVAQQLRNNCETAALEVLMRSLGFTADQLELQRRISRSGPMDPVERATGRLWGDPERGYVGRADGGGVAGGFGVYPGPVRKLALREGVGVEDVSGRPEDLYARLRTGRVAIVWIGLSEGPYGSWTSPRGRRVRVNFGEHTVVLHGIDEKDDLDVVNVLEGTRERWTREQFEGLWARLGRRALVSKQT